MKNIILHRPTTDNAGRYQDAGTTLAIAEGAEENTISAERSKELLDSEGAAFVPTATRDPLDHDGDGRKGGSVKAAG